MNSKYLCVSVNSTPDISLLGQFDIIVRYIDSSNKIIFIGFTNIKSHTRKQLASISLKHLKNSIYISDIAIIMLRTWWNTQGIVRYC